MASDVRVSVITPTYGRERHLANLVACFRWQTQPDRELLILDDSPEPSRLFASGALRDPAIRYLHSRERLSIGEKRNRLVEASRGEIVVQFDDDDYYAPRYVEAMVGALRDADLVKLGGWFGYSVARGQFFYWDTTRILDHHYAFGPGALLEVVSIGSPPAEFVDSTLWGFGLSYVFRRRTLERARFADRDWGEDYAFVCALRDAGLRVAQVPDSAGLALHVIHSSNTSRVFPQYLIPPALVGRFFGPAVRPFVESSAPGSPRTATRPG
jgi:glycosyltransferase involved in cell wall biosynthesis